MSIEPAFETFEQMYQGGKAQVVWTRLIGDLETPVSAMMKLADGQANSMLFESVEGNEVRGRYSIITLKPDLIWKCADGSACLNRRVQQNLDDFTPCDEPPLEALRVLIEASKIELPQGLPPMAAGVFGYLGYDMVRLMEHLPNVPDDPLGLPDAILMRPTIVAIFDSVTDEIIVVTPVRPQNDISAQEARDLASQRLDEVRHALDYPLPARETVTDGEADETQPVSNTLYKDYLAKVETAKAYIKAGDVFQVVPSQRFSKAFTLPPFSLYRALRKTNPSPFLYFLNFGGFQIVGSSPEILVRLRDERVTIRPIAGTRPRGKTPKEDLALEQELLADAKERAEHLMLLDLGRNDTGRVSRPGSVEVTERFTIERYSHVMHIVSNVEGDLADGFDAVSALVAGFPAGTVSGAPKVRAMEIIDELEDEKRGVYAGSVGYFSAAGDMDTCIVLRTAVVKDETMYVQAGGGVVHDSDPDFEHRETVNKARALFAAAHEAHKFV